jgi:hypothetical protein
MTPFEVSRELFDVDHRFADIDGARILYVVERSGRSGRRGRRT